MLIRKKEEMMDFDERQLLLRGKSYQLMAVLTIALLLLDAFLGGAGIEWAPRGFSSLVILMLIVSAGCIDMMRKEVLFGQKRKSARLVLPVVGLLSLATCLLTFWEFLSEKKEFIGAGGLSEEGAIFFLNIIVCALAIILFFIWLKKNRQSAEE